VHCGRKWGIKMFMGEYHHNIDDKNRLVIPSNYRELLGETFVITRGLEKCLYVYTESEWQKIVDKLASLPFTKKDARVFVRSFFSAAANCNFDKQGRISITSTQSEYASLNNVPIMMDDGIDYMCRYIEEHNVKNILEIGTAIGYSAIRMALVREGICVTTIERDEKRYLEALSNVSKAKLNERITLIFKDAMDVELDSKYDLIFIDAAKAQSIKFFQKFKANLDDNGVIITDNLNFHGLVLEDISNIASRNVRGLVKKIRNYINFLEENEEFQTTFLDVGDGISISQRKKNVS